jgi:hypothetical protein
MLNYRFSVNFDIFSPLLTIRCSCTSCQSDQTCHSVATTQTTMTTDLIRTQFLLILLSKHSQRWSP